MKEKEKYQVAFTSKVHEELKLYVPAQDTDYHISRYVAAGAHNIYSSVGASKEVLTAVLDKMLTLCNEDKNNNSMRTDIAILANNLKYRMQYPVDEDCALRMGAIYCFLEDENPDETHDVFTRKKLLYAKGNGLDIPADPDLYAFFLNLGVQSTPSWKEYVTVLQDTDYLTSRQVTLNSLMPQRTL